MRTYSVRWLAIGLIALSVLTSCGGMGCDVIGFVSAVKASSSISSWSIEELCIDDECVKPQTDSGDASVTVANEPGSHSYRLTIVGPDEGRVERSGEVVTRVFELNGAGCEPRTANASLILREGGTVAISYP